MAFNNVRIALGIEPFHLNLCNFNFNLSFAETILFFYRIRTRNDPLGYEPIMQPLTPYRKIIRQVTLLIFL